MGGTARAANSDMTIYSYSGNVWEVGSFGQVGSTAYMVGVVDSISPILYKTPGSTWTFYMYDLVATGASRNGNVVTVFYTGGKIEVHEDKVNTPAYCYGSTTPPNECAPSTFVDGELVLSAHMNNFMIVQNTQTGTGSFSSDDVMFDGGSQLGNLPTTMGYTIGSDINAYANQGYQHYAFGHVNLLVTTPTKPTTWGHIKSLYDVAR
jgi:hypothetical protein